MTLLAIVAIHTAANEPPKVRQVMNKIHRNVALHRRAGRGALEARHTYNTHDALSSHTDATRSSPPALAPQNHVNASLLLRGRRCPRCGRLGHRRPGHRRCRCRRCCRLQRFHHHHHHHHYYTL